MAEPYKTEAQTLVQRAVADLQEALDASALPITVAELLAHSDPLGSHTDPMVAYHLGVLDGIAMWNKTTTRQIVADSAVTHTIPS